MITSKIEYARRAYLYLDRQRHMKPDVTVTYKDLATAIGYGKALHHQEFADILTILTIQDPDLGGRVRRQDTGQPGVGYYWVCEQLGIKPSVAVQAEIMEVMG